MSKRNIGYVIELNPKDRRSVFVYSNNLRGAFVFSTRESAREDKRRSGGLAIEIIWQVALSLDGEPIHIIKKVR